MGDLHAVCLQVPRVMRVHCTSEPGTVVVITGVLSLSLSVCAFSSRPGGRERDESRAGSISDSSVIWSLL